MRIGLTYDLAEDHTRTGTSAEDAAEFDSPGTIAAIDSSLRALGFVTDHVGHVKALATRLVAGDRWDLVFNIAEGVHGVGREAQVPALLDAFQIPYTFSDPMVMGLCLHKGMTKHVVRDAGIPTPDFALVASTSDLAGVRLDYPVFAKPVAEGTSKGITGSSVASTAEELARVCAGLLRRYRQPVLVEAYLPGREFTVGVIGTGESAHTVGALEVRLRSTAERGGYTYENKLRYEDLIDLTLATDDVARQAEAVALAAWRVLGCRDAGRVDVRCNAVREPQFLEVNPLAGLNPVRSDLPILWGLGGHSYEELIAAIVTSAQERTPGPPPA